MKYFHYNIKDDEIVTSQGEVHTVPADFIEYRVNMMGQRVFYKIRNGKLTELIAEGGDVDNANRKAEDFLAGLNDKEMRLRLIFLLRIMRIPLNEPSSIVDQIKDGRCRTFEK